MIRTFRNKALQSFAERGDARRLSIQNTRRVRQVLDLLDAAKAPQALNLPGLFLHELKQTPGRYSVRLTGNWRITFRFDGQDAVDVDLEDYH
jgi:proteic killer suppression protein